ncbi:hypothetical protein BZG36_00842 [Bifiguratus adelaidae]|uniref:DHS-like NAD/FAD-binding domain-containing protein n=1 Tax=Bifiguratus adelaidae TaxID=1938954 RepID=A0A261Y6L8_9FUNG|nr:hypothetical protein BZG36_00842 [Bifiguratus adelaidae]
MTVIEDDINQSASGQLWIDTKGSKQSSLGHHDAMSDQEVLSDGLKPDITDDDNTSHDWSQHTLQAMFESFDVEDENDEPEETYALPSPVCMVAVPPPDSMIDSTEPPSTHHNGTSVRKSSRSSDEEYNGMTSSGASTSTHTPVEGALSEVTTQVSAQQSLLSLTPTITDTWNSESLTTMQDMSYHQLSQASFTASPLEHKRSLKRLYALQELLSTEKDYLLDLQNLVEHYLRPINYMNWISDEHKLLIIRNTPELKRFQEDFYIDLHAAFMVGDAHVRRLSLNAKESVRAVANVFVSRGKDFRVYRDYCAFHNEALELVYEYRTRPEWTTLMKECCANIPETSNGGRLQLTDYMIKPVQRICRYHLLLREILKSTSEDSAEYEAMNSAVNVMANIAEQVNVATKKRDHIIRTLRFHERLEEEWRLTKNFVKQLGDVILVGALEMIYYPSCLMKPKYYGCFVFDSYMIIVRVKKSTQYEPKHWFPLRLFRIAEPVAGQAYLTDSFLLVYRDHVFEFGATCRQERDLWMSSISKAIHYSNEEFKFRHPSGDDNGETEEDLLLSSLPYEVNPVDSSVVSSPVRASRSYTNLFDLNIRSASSTHMMKSHSANTSTACHTTPYENLAHPLSEANSPIQSEPLTEYFDAKSPRHDQDFSSRSNSALNKLRSPYHKRSNSLDLKELFLTTNVAAPVINKAPTKTATSLSVRISVDNKLQDVCTLDYIAARATIMPQSNDMKRRASAYNKLSPSNIPLRPLLSVDGLNDARSADDGSPSDLTPSMLSPISSPSALSDDFKAPLSSASSFKATARRKLSNMTLEINTATANTMYKTTTSPLNHQPTTPTFSRPVAHDMTKSKRKSMVNLTRTLSQSLNFNSSPTIDPQSPTLRQSPASRSLPPQNPNAARRSPTQGPSSPIRRYFATPPRLTKSYPISEDNLVEVKEQSSPLPPAPSDNSDRPERTYSAAEAEYNQREDYESKVKTVESGEAVRDAQREPSPSKRVRMSSSGDESADDLREIVKTTVVDCSENDAIAQHVTSDTTIEATTVSPNATSFNKTSYEAESPIQPGSPHTAHDSDHEISEEEPQLPTPNTAEGSALYSDDLSDSDDLEFLESSNSDFNREYSQDFDQFTDEEKAIIQEDVRKRGLGNFIYEYIVNRQIPVAKLFDVFAPLPPKSDVIQWESHLLYLLTQVLRIHLKRRKLEHINTLEDVRDLIQKSRKIMVLTGAGVSVSCGIPDFRSEKGIYSRLDEYQLDDPQQMFDISFFRERPEIFYSFAKEIYPSNFEPSPSHYFIKLLEEKDKLLRNYTQNIDTLEHKAGIQKVLNCHGSFATATCITCGYKCMGSDIEKDIFAQTVPQCPQCTPKPRKAGNDSDDETDYFRPRESILKPDITFFGEKLASAFEENLMRDREEVDLLIVMGSSLKVAPVSEIMGVIPPDIPQILINRTPILHMQFDVQLLGDADAIVPEICRLLNWDLRHPKLPGGSSLSDERQALSRPNQSVDPESSASSTSQQSPLWEYVGQGVYLFEGAVVDPEYFQDYRCDQLGDRGSSDPSPSAEMDEASQAQLKILP